MTHKKGYRVEIKIKEYNGSHLQTVDYYKKISPEAAVILLMKKYLQRNKKKTLLNRFDEIFNSVSKEIEKALEIRP